MAAAPTPAQIPGLSLRIFTNDMYIGKSPTIGYSVYFVGKEIMVLEARNN